MHTQPSLRSKLTALLSVDFVRFCIVGAFGFVVNSTLLHVLFHRLELPIYVAQAISGEVAYLSNFFFHNRWTYRGRTDKDLVRLLVEFHASSWSGMLLTLLIVTLLVSVFRSGDIVALAVASGLVLFWNYFWTKFFIWRKRGVQPVVPEPHPAD